MPKNATVSCLWIKVITVDFRVCAIFRSKLALAEFSKYFWIWGIKKRRKSKIHKLLIISPMSEGIHPLYGFSFTQLYYVSAVCQVSVVYVR